MYDGECCVECGAEIETDCFYRNYGRPARYCSPACRQRAYRKRKGQGTRTRAQADAQRQATKAANVRVKICPCCSQYLKVSAAQAHRVYCSPACRQKAYRIRQRAQTTDLAPSNWPGGDLAGTLVDVLAEFGPDAILAATKG